jgi:hypothetical protein
MSKGKLTLEELVSKLRERHFFVSRRVNTKLEIYERKRVAIIYFRKKFVRFYQVIHIKFHKGFGFENGVYKPKLKPLIDFIKQRGYSTNARAGF